MSPPEPLPPVAPPVKRGWLLLLAVIAWLLWNATLLAIALSR